MRPSSLTTSAVTPVVPASRASTVMPGWSSESRLGRRDAQLFEHDGVDPAGQQPFLVVLDAGPRRECLVEILVVVAERAQAAANLVGQLALQWLGAVGIGLAEVDVVQVEQSGELGDRTVVVVDAQVDEHVA